jgi:hypothetical protein
MESPNDPAAMSLLPPLPVSHQRQRSKSINPTVILTPLVKRTSIARRPSFMPSTREDKEELSFPILIHPPSSGSSALLPERVSSRILTLNIPSVSTAGFGDLESSLMRPHANFQSDTSNGLAHKDDRFSLPTVSIYASI